MRWTKPIIEQLKTLVKSGMTDREIASFFNCTVSAVEHARDRNGVRKVQMSKRHRQKDILEEVSTYVDQINKTHSKYNDLYKKVPLRTKWDGVKQTEDQVLMLSDMHTDMINKAPITGEVTYSPEIQKKELQTLVEGISRFHQLYSPSYNIETLYIFGLGDLITNDRIYEGQKMEIAAGVGKQIQKTFYYVSDLIKKLLEIYPRIVYINEVGNHGRTTSKPISEEATSNFEYLIGLLLQERFKDNKRVEIILPEDYSYTYRIRNHRYLLTHGNSIRGATLNSIEKAAKEISLLVEQEHYDVITIGHFHSCYELPISPTTTLLVNGCFIFKDEYAYSKLRKFSTAKQYLFNVSKRSACHNIQKLDLRWK